MKKQRLNARAILLIIILSLAAILINYFLWRRIQVRSAEDSHIEMLQSDVRQ